MYTYQSGKGDAATGDTGHTEGHVDVVGLPSCRAHKDKP